jgi:hypothetical protein
MLADSDEVDRGQFQESILLVHDCLSKLLDHLELTALNQVLAVKFDSVEVE